MHTEQQVTSHDFLYWQCRIRQQAVRTGDGRPTQGMCPNVIINKDMQSGQIITLITKASPENMTAQFRHIVKKTQDQAEHREAAIRLFSGMYYQDPKDFSDEITALFGSDSRIHARLIESKTCILSFEQNRQCFQIPCKVTDLSPEHPRYQFTFWHNSLFNPFIPANINILAFIPDWSEARSDKLS